MEAHRWRASGQAMTAAASPFYLAGAVLALFSLRFPLSVNDAFWLVGSAVNGVFAIADLLDGIWQIAILHALMSAICLWAWWHKRKRRRRALAWLGSKSRALRDALVRKVREARQPRRILAPAPVLCPSCANGPSAGSAHARFAAAGGQAASAWTVHGGARSASFTSRPN